MSEVQATCDRVVIINEGKIVADGSLDQLQEDMRGSELVEIEIRAEVNEAMEDIFPKFKAIDGAETVEMVSSKGDLHRFNIRSAKGNDLREPVFRQIVNQDWVLLEMQRQTTSIEELFHTLTSGQEKEINPFIHKESALTVEQSVEEPEEKSGDHEKYMPKDN